MKNSIRHKIQTFGGLLLLLFILLEFSACSTNKNKGLTLIPKDATAVFSINFNQIQEKLKDGNFNTDSLMDVLKTQDSVFVLLKDFDLRQPLLAFVKNSSTMMAGKDLLSGFVASISDRADLEKNLKNLYPDKNIEKGKNASYIQLKDNTYAAWNDGFMISLVGSALTADQVDALFAMKKDASMADNKEAVKLLTVKSDLSFYVNGNGSLASIPFISMSKASDLIKDNYGGGTINFEKGKVLFDAKYYLNGTLTDLIKKNPTKDLAGDGLKNFPGKPLGFFEVSFNLKQILSFLEYAGVKNTADVYLKNMGLSLDDLQKAFVGEINVALSDVGVTTQSIPFGDTSLTINRPEPKVLVNIPIADKASYDKIVTALGTVGMFVNQNGQWVPKELIDPSKGVYIANNKSVIYATDKTLADAFLSGSKSIEYPKDLDRKNKTSIGYVDLGKMIQAMSRSGQNQDSSLQLAIQTFDDVSMSADNIKGNVCSYTMVLHLKDQSKNSLPVLMEFVKKNDLLNKAKKSADTLDDSMNTNIQPPPSMNQPDSGK